jgi:hypothetical protein
MKKSNLRRIGAVAAFVAIALAFSSCNRGYGCPTFSLGDFATTIIAKVID